MLFFTSSAALNPTNPNPSYSHFARIWQRLHRFGAPKSAYDFAAKWQSRLAGLALILLLGGGYAGLVLAPPDYQMGDSYRILFVHAPMAWMSLFSYAFMAGAAGCGLIWRLKVADALARATAPVGAGFTFCALVTGALWGKPTWGTYWVWDARLTSELLLLFLFLGYIALADAFSQRQAGSRAAAVLALVGVVNLPIIHFSVEWWNTLHQGASVAQFAKPSVATEMLAPLLLMFIGFQVYFFAALLARLRVELLAQARRAKWVREVLDG